MCHTGWLNAYKEGGWLPSWASPGYRNCMVGTFADVVVADAIVKGVPGFDLNLAKDALMKDVSYPKKRS
jgi:putative alpha-1,2-mannosidase